MQRLRLFSIRVCLFLALSSACLASVTPREDVSLSTVNKITKYAQQFSRTVPHVRKTTITSHSFPSKALVNYVSNSRLHSLNSNLKTHTNRLRTIVDAISARTTPLNVSSRQSGLNFDICSSSDDCVGPRLCVGEEEGKLITCVTGEACVCAQIIPSEALCIGEGDCDTGESCIRTESGSFFCVSNTAGQGSNPGPDSGSGNDGDGSSSGTSSSGSDSGSSSNGDGLNADPCSNDSDCASPRRCVELNDDDFVACNSGDGCLCVPTDPNDLLCTSDSNCDVGESCVPVESNMLCISDDVIERQSPENDPEPPSDGDGLNLDPCSDDSDCASPRTCVELNDDDFVTCNSGDGCLCVPTDPNDLLCTSDSNCDVGESCVPRESNMLCISDDAIEGPPRRDPEPSSNGDNDPSPSPSQSPIIGGDLESPVDGNDDPSPSPSSSDQPQAVCIGSESLTHLTREELAFEQDALAHVLCDMNESCATPGHMVVYKGEAMMMKNYCKVVGCARRVKRVNSPKYIRKLVIPSRTQELVFTGFAARYETVAEEGVLSAAVRFGF